MRIATHSRTEKSCRHRACGFDGRAALRAARLRATAPDLRPGLFSGCADRRDRNEARGPLGRRFQSRFPFRFRFHQPLLPAAFTLIELLVVIAVAGILAAIAVPAIKEFGRSNQQVAATRQVLDAVGRARQLAIANRTTVYMVFLPNGFLNLNLPFDGNLGALDTQQADAALRLAPLQGRAFALMSLRTIGDQPGDNRPQYLTEWTPLARGWIFDTNKFVRDVTFTNANSTGPIDWFVRRFDGTNGLPFPVAGAPRGEFFLPYIAFDYSGQLTSREDEYIPIARGRVEPQIDLATGDYLTGDANIKESPPGNSFSEYNLIKIDWLTGRAKLIERKIE